MHLNPTYLFLGLVSAALSISSTCAVPLNASPGDSLATRSSIQNKVPAGPVGGLPENEVYVYFYDGFQSEPNNIDENAIQTKVERTVKGYLRKKGLTTNVCIKIMRWPDTNDVERFDVSGPGVQGGPLWFDRSKSTSTAETITWSASGTKWTVAA
ncbi:hypothetical protein GG344DRAFT_79573 [Lentinula edodes]|nr:hypothetical protein GG344DRAFT_79573 [Lentinula edodes]